MFAKAKMAASMGLIEPLIPNEVSVRTDGASDDDDDADGEKTSTFSVITATGVCLLAASGCKCILVSLAHHTDCT